MSAVFSLFFSRLFFHLQKNALHFILTVIGLKPVA